MKNLTRPVERVVGKLGSRHAERWFAAAAVVALGLSALMSLLVAPPDAVQGNVQRLMYVHVPSAWLAYLSFTIVFGASVAYLITKRGFWDHLAAAAAEIGVLFTALTIALGSIWGYPTWGTWWTWDPRLTTTAVMLLIYLGYLAVRRLPENRSRRARWAAVVGIVGFIDVPMVHMSTVWWRSLHQPATVLQPGQPTIAPIMLWTLLFAVLAFTVAFGYFLVARLRVGRLEDRVLGAAMLAAPEAGPPELVWPGQEVAVDG